MARSNTANAANWFSRASASGITANPISMSCWFYPFNLTSTSCLMAVGDAGASSYHALLFDGANAYAAGDNKIIIDNSSSFGSSSGAVANANEWNHACSVNASTTSRIAFLNGVAGTTNTGSSAATSYNHIDVGAIRSTTTTFNPIDGRIAEVAFWSAALTQDEVTMLSKGVSPLQVRPNNLNRYWPLIRGGANEIDRILREVLVQNGTMAQEEHVRQFYPTGPLLIGLGTTASGAGVGAASGVGAATGVAASTVAAIAAATGLGAVAGVAASSVAAVASAAGVGVANGVSATIAASVAAATGTSTVNGVSASSVASIGSSTGTGSALGVAASSVAAIGSAAGTSAVDGVGAAAGGGSVGSATGTSTVSGISASTVAATGNAAGTSNVIAFSGATQPGTDTGGSGNASHGAGRGRNINDDPDAFSELLKEWRARKEQKEFVSPEPTTASTTQDEGVESAAASPHSSTLAPSDDLQAYLSRVEAAFDRSMVAYEAALAKVEQAKAAKAAKAQRAVIAQEELARQQAMQLAIEWELARLAYEDFLEEEDEIMLLTGT